MEEKSLTAQLYAAAELMQEQAKDLRERVAQLYTRAGKLKSLAIAVANNNPQPTTEKAKTK